MSYIVILTMAFFALSILPVFAAVYPNDSDTSKQWYLEKIGAYDAWSKSKGSSDAVVAVLDTGVDIDHPDLQYNIWQNPNEIIDGKDNDGNIYMDDINGWDFVDGDSDPRPDLDDPNGTKAAINHGTLVAGIIGAMGDNSLGGAGLNWRVKIMPLRVLNSQGQGDVNAVEEAVRYAIDKGADIINLSFVGPGFDKKLFIALRDAYRAGILVVAAVGNQTYEGIDLDYDPLYPVCYSGSEGEDVVLGVAALDQNDKKPAFSNYGKNCVDLTAPGVDMYGPQVYKPGLGFPDMFGGGWKGTSLAAPVVTGVAALIKSVNPAYKAPEIRDILLATADNVYNGDFATKLGAGRLNAKKAMEAAGGGGVVSASSALGLNYLLAAPYVVGAPEVQVLRQTGTQVSKFLAYAPNFQKGVRVAAGDVTGSSSEEIVVGAGPGGGPHVRVFRADGTVVSSFFAYDKNFRGGVNVAVGDIDGDGTDEIIAGAGKGGGPHVRIFRTDGTLVTSFFAYDKNLRGGVNVTVGDIDNDGREEIITAPGPGVSPEVKVFNDHGKQILSFMAFPQNMKAGVNVAFGNVDGNGTGRFIVSLMAGGPPEVRVFNVGGVWQRAFMVYDETFKGGINLAVGDLDKNGTAEIVVGLGQGGNSQIIVFDGYGKIKNQLTPFDKNFKGGVSVGVIKL